MSHQKIPSRKLRVVLLRTAIVGSIIGLIFLATALLIRAEPNGAGDAIRSPSDEHRVAQRIQSEPVGQAQRLASPLPAPATSFEPVLLPSPTPTPEFRSGALQASLSGIEHEWQTWNNCGPATMAMTLSYFDLEQSQADVATFLRPNSDDKNVSPGELAAHARTLGLEAIVRVNGEPEILKRLIANGIPVIVEVWLEPEPGDGFGHYRLLSGYDNDAQVWTAYDSYVSDGLINPGGDYRGIEIPYSVLDEQWPVFHRTYIVAYRPEQERAVAFALGENMDDSTMWARALERAQVEIDADAANAFAWFNRGSALVGLQRYEEAAAAYDQAFSIGLPWRMLWYQFGPLEAYERTGRHADVVRRADVALQTTSNVEELYYWRGLGLAGLGDLVEARAALSRALELRPDFKQAREALSSLSAS